MSTDLYRLHQGFLNGLRDLERKAFNTKKP